MEKHWMPKYALVHKETGECARKACGCLIESTEYGWLLTADSKKGKCYIPVIMSNKENYHWVEVK